jgi:hypothetical protein
VSRDGWRSATKQRAMTPITYPAIYAECLDIAYREADHRESGDPLYTSIIANADTLYHRITSEQITRQ